ncbi:urease accessory protein UreF [Oharaeibacter diazotrophicus]|uniref:Urease accessory protein UreF n=2 Tax=Oharaeibacter diazotrophicus TaxID=1920512 RepID=A0A4R6R5E7_9HYPH|nr:urease accessory UreF family protein [Oharaeibacter diazotrophicus]TDP81130.1 urease accessory protein [Oharaeibacter diazotrophicus]BBE74877.1 urease accessory protein UreF [Pleomorphomonas sp. SM30]GLS75619.1 urease accessory protein UreF [Oharaeibacter diazotrophicus]
MGTEQLLIALQQGDSAFPSGGFAFSWGLEELAAGGLVATAADVEGFLDDLVVQRWNGFDRVFLGRAHGAPDLDALAAVDRAVEVATWSEAVRAGSRRAGRALLGVQARLIGGDAAAWRARVEGDDELGHLAPAQGLVWRLAGLDLAAAEALSAWSLVQGVAAAALRLGLLGHLAAQGVAARNRARLSALLARPAPDEPAGFTPVADIALGRHARRDARLFAT